MAKGGAVLRGAWRGNPDAVEGGRPRAPRRQRARPARPRPCPWPNSERRARRRSADQYRRPSRRAAAAAGRPLPPPFFPGAAPAALASPAPARVSAASQHGRRGAPGGRRTKEVPPGSGSWRPLIGGRGPSAHGNRLARVRHFSLPARAVQGPPVRHKARVQRRRARRAHTGQGHNRGRQKRRRVLRLFHDGGQKGQGVQGHVAGQHEGEVRGSADGHRSVRGGPGALSLHHGRVRQEGGGCSAGCPLGGGSTRSPTMKRRLAGQGRRRQVLGPGDRHDLVRHCDRRGRVRRDEGHSRAEEPQGEARCCKAHFPRHAELYNGLYGTSPIARHYDMYSMAEDARCGAARCRQAPAGSLRVQ